MNLNVKSKKVFTVIMPPNGDTMSLLEGMQSFKDYLKANSLHYAMAFHLMDVEDDGTPKRPHLHVFIEYLECKRLNTRLSEISKVFELNPLAVSIQKAENDSACIRYLLHVDNPEKYQYDRKSIISNIPTDEIDLVLASPNDSMSFSRIRDLCMQCPTLLQVIEAVGISMYRAYRPVIMDMWKEVRGYRN